RKDGQITVDMGAPRFSPAEIPFQADSEALSYPLEVGEQQLQVSALSMGNPHSVTLVDNLDQNPEAKIAPLGARHARCPRPRNAGSMQLVDRPGARLRLHERGVGETLACGTGACAAAVVGIRLGHLYSRVSIELPGGTLQNEWAVPGHSAITT